MDSSRYLLYNFQAGIGDTIRHIGTLEGSEPEFSECIITDVDSIALWDTVVARRHIQYTGLDPWNYMFYGPIIDEVSSLDCLVPQFGACDPGAGPLVSYAHPTKGYHCFEPQLCAKILLTADYTVFPKNKTMFYRVSDELDRPIYAVGFDDIQVAADTFLLYPNKSITDSLEFLIAKPGIDDCYAGDGGWMFHHLQINPDGEAIFYLGDTLLSLEKPGADEFRVLTKAGLNESWIAMESFLPEGDDLVITATVTDIFEMEVLGIMDTVKRISLSSPHLAVDHLSILLGKHTGLVQAINFRQIRNPISFSPNPYDHQGNYTLVGADKNFNGVRNLTWEEVWHFNVGDVLHIHNFIITAGASLDTQITDIIWEILNADYGSTMSYEIDEQKRVISGPGGASVILSRDTIAEQFQRRMPQFDAIPGTRFIEEPFGSYQQGIFNGRSSKCTNQSASFYYYDQGCYMESIVDGCFDCVQYIKGLGGGYYNCQGQEGDKHIYELIYYQKGSEEWGTPFDFTVSTKEVSTEFGFKYYPNPADKTVLIQAPQSGRYDIVILNIQGQMLLRETQGQTTSEIDVSKLSPGMYFIQIICESDLVYIKPLIIQH
jgi:hypothetical protein